MTATKSQLYMVGALVVAACGTPGWYTNIVIVYLLIVSYMAYKE
jgi:hypothetical protein